MNTNSIKSRIIIALFAVFCMTTIYSQGFTKKFVEQYSSNESTVVEISNKFGDVKVLDWDKNEVKIEVTIEVNTSLERKAERIFEDIDIEISKSGNVISGETALHSDGNNNSDFTINYEVHMPKNLRLMLYNKYGHVFINELSGPVNVEVKYGSFKANKLSHGKEEPRNRVYLGYSKNSVIEECSWLKLELAYSTLEIRKAEVMRLETKYSKFFIDEVSTITAESKYDKYSIGNIKKFRIDGKYSGYKVDNIYSSLELDTRYSNVNVYKIHDDFSDIEIDNAYGNIDLNIDDGASYELRAEGQYCTIHYPKSKNLNTQHENTSIKLWGKIGENQSPKSRVYIESRYGNVKL